MCMETQRNPNSQNNTEKEKRLEKSGSLTSDYTTKLQSSKEYGNGTKQKYRSRLQDRKPKINPHTYGQLIYNKGGKTIQWRKDVLFSK